MSTAFNATILVLLAALVRPLSAQTPLDGVLLKFGGDVITMSDVRQARLLKLVVASGDTDQAFVDALVRRRLILDELRRNPPPEPAPAAVEARLREWESKLGADAPALLVRAGMTEPAARAWLRDDLRIATYLDQRFPPSGDRAAAIAAWEADLRQRAGIR
jgi:hypothetical protein